MHKIKIVYAQNIATLEKDINRVLSKINNLIDIKFTEINGYITAYIIYKN